MKTKLNCVCGVCGTDNILMRTGVDWDVKTQRLEPLYNSIDTFCTHCNDDVEIQFIRLLSSRFSSLLDELEISIACLLDTAMDEETQADIEHIQNYFSAVLNKLKDPEYNIYEMECLTC